MDIASFENVMGRILSDDPEHPTSAMAVTGDFAFCAGEPDIELLCSKPDCWMPVVPQNEVWATLIIRRLFCNRAMAPNYTGRRHDSPLPVF